MDEDMILPDDFEATIPEETQEQTQELSQEEQVETVEDTKPTEETSEPVQEAPKLKVKYNHEEREITLEEATQLAQKGMNYDKLQEKINSLQSDPRLSFVEELAKDYGMNTEEFLKAAREQREQQRLNELVQQNIPEEYAKEILENRKFREQFTAKEKETQEQAKQQQMFNDFVQSFPNVKPDDIPQTVWDKVNEGTPLKFAYMEHEYQQTQNQLKVYQQNQTNAAKAPVGSVTKHGSQEVTQEDDFLRGFNSI